MDFLLGFITLMGAAFAGYLVFRLCRLPMPAFLGPMVSTGVLNYFYLYPEIPLDVPSFLCKVLIGISLGRRFDRTVFSTLRELPVPALITAVWMMGISLAAGFILFACTDLPLGTALIGSSAGGIAEMAIFAMALGANTVTVTFIQLFRLVFTLFSIPFLVKGWTWFSSRRGIGWAPAQKIDRVALEGEFTFHRYVVMVLAALFGGGLGEFYGVPAGAMLGAMAGSGVVVALSGRNCYLPRKLMSIAQFCIGTVIAKSMTHDTVLALGDLILPLFLPTFILLFLCMTLSYILAKITHWDPMTCILATLPAGLIQIVPIAEEYGADVLKVGVLHTVRLISIIVFLPVIIRVIIA